MRRSIGMLAIALAVLVLLETSTAAGHVSVRVQPKPATRQDVHVTFHGPPLPEGGYYYAVIVLRPYKMYTQTSPPPCATSSDMRRTDYGYPSRSGRITLALTPAKSSVGHWCPGGRYVGAIYAVPHAPPCKDTYPCRSETYEEPCVGVRPGCVLGVVAEPGKWSYPQGPPAPLARGTTIVGRFALSFATAAHSTVVPESKAPQIQSRS
jgi:hypothetical protein